MAETEAAIVLARTDRDTARQLLGLLTIGCRALDRFEEKRAYLFGFGIPAEVLPSARELDRIDLVWRRSLSLELGRWLIKRFVGHEFRRIAAHKLCHRSCVFTVVRS